MMYSAAVVRGYQIPVVLGIFICEIIDQGLKRKVEQKRNLSLKISNPQPKKQCIAQNFNRVRSTHCVPLSVDISKYYYHLQARKMCERILSFSRIKNLTFQLKIYNLHMFLFAYTKNFKLHDLPSPSIDM